MPGVTPRLPAAVVVLALAALGGRCYDARPGGDDFGSTENRHVLEAARRLGTLHAHADLVHVHVFSYPPFTVLPFLPFTLLPFRAAAVVWQALSLGLLALSRWCLWRAVPLSPVGGTLLIALTLLYEPLENSLGLGQINLLILALASVFLWALVSGRAALAGVSLGLAVAMRFHPALFFVYLAWRRKWAPLARGVATAAGCTMHPRLHGGPQILLGGIKTYGLVLLGAVMAAVVRPAPAQVRS